MPGRLLSAFLLVNVADRLGKLVSEVIEALYVCLDHFKLFQTLILRKLGLLVLTSATGPAWFCSSRQPEVCLYRDFLPETLDRHEDDSVLARLLQELLRIVLVGKNELGLLSLNLLQLLLLFCNQVGELERLCTGHFVELVHLASDAVDRCLTALVPLFQNFMSAR